MPSRANYRMAITAPSERLMDAGACLDSRHIYDVSTTLLLEHFLPDEARVRLIMTKQGKVYVAAEPLKPLSADVYEVGVRVETIRIHRDRPHLKSTAFIGTSESERNHIAQEGI